MDSTPIIVSAIGAVGTIITAWLTHSQARLAKENSIKTHDAVNSRMDEMKRLIQASAFAEGQKSERESTEAKAAAFEAGKQQIQKEP